MGHRLAAEMIVLQFAVTFFYDEELIGGRKSPQIAFLEMTILSVLHCLGTHNRLG